MLLLGIMILSLSWYTELDSNKAKGKEGEPLFLGLDNGNIVLTKDSRPQLGERLPARVTPFFFRKIPINRADPELLQLVPGVGPHLASNIITYRDEFGFFTDEVQLLEVSGIGPKRKELLREWLIFD